MEHWFDSATKALAGRSLGRREVFKTAALAGVASLLPRQSCAQSVLREARVQPSPAAAPCTRTSVGGKRKTTVSASAKYKGQTLSLRSVLTTFGRRFSQATSRVELDSHSMAYSARNPIFSIQDGS
jgi:hypothetical protein